MSWFNYTLHYPTDDPPPLVHTDEALNPIAATLAALPGAVCAQCEQGALVVSLTALVGHALPLFLK